MGSSEDGEYNSPSQAKGDKRSPHFLPAFSLRPFSSLSPLPDMGIGGGGGRFIHLLNHERGAKSGVMSVQRPTVVVVQQRRHGSRVLCPAEPTFPPFSVPTHKSIHNNSPALARPAVSQNLHYLMEFAAKSKKSFFSFPTLLYR